MCDINQLENAIQQMGANAEASQFVTQVFQADNFQFLKLVTQILLSPNLPDKIMTNSVTLISIVLRPSITRPINLIAQNYYNFSEDERTQIKQAIIRGLMHEDHKTRLDFAYCLGFIVMIDKQYETMMRINTIGKPTIFDTYLINLIQSQPTPYAPIGSIMAITQILENGTINPKIRKYQNLNKIILEVGYTVLAKNGELDNLLLEFKIECARCIDEGIKIGLFDEFLSRLDEKARFLQSIIPNTTIPNPQLHDTLLCLLKDFNILLFRLFRANPIKDNIVPFLEQIFQNTIQPVSAIKTENFNIQTMEPFIRDVIEMWEEFAKYESENYIKSISFTSLIANNMDELLFAYIALLPVEDLLESNPENTISFFAYQCLIEFSKAAPDIVYQHALYVYNSSIQGGNRQSIFVAFVAAQIIFQISQTTKEVLFKILTDIIKFTSFNDPSIVLTAYAAIITACQSHPSVCKEPEFFNFLLQSISNSIQSNSSNIVERALVSFSNLITPFDRTDNTSNLSSCYQAVMPMLMNLTQRPDVSVKLELQHEIFFSIRKYVSKLPMSIPSAEVLKYGLQIQEQMKKLIIDHPDGGLQIRAWLSIIVYGITIKLQAEILPLAMDFLNILITTCEEINSTRANINSHEDVISAIGSIVYVTDKVSAPLIPRILDIAMTCLQTQNSTLISSASQLLTYLFKNFKVALKDAVPNFLNTLIDCLVAQTSNEVTIFFILRAITSILLIGTIENNDDLKIYQVIGGLLQPRRVELMNLAVTLIPFLSTFQKNSEENALCLFSALLQFFTTIMKVYFYERTVNPNDTSKYFPSEFIASYKDKFIEIITEGDKLSLINNSICFDFLEYVEMIIITFNTSHHMNVKIHKPGFKNYFAYALNGDPKLRRAASIVKSKYEKA